MKRLQVWDENLKVWQYVFCSNLNQSEKPITTKYKYKALKAHALPYFENKYGNHIFQISVV